MKKYEAARATSRGKLKEEEEVKLEHFDLFYHSYHTGRLKHLYYKTPILIIYIKLFNTIMTFFNKKKIDRFFQVHEKTN